MLDFSILTEYWGTFMLGFWNTVKASVIALAASLVLGTIIAVCRISVFAPLRWISTAYTEFVRNIPLLLIVLLMYLGFKLPGFAAGVTGLSLYTAAFIAEAIRAGIQSVPKGQSEAARATGLTYLQMMRYVVLPQAFKIVIPPLGNQFLNLVKNSSILAVVAGMDIMYYADIISTDTFVVFSVYIFVACFYLLITIPLSLAISFVERRLHTVR